MTMDTTKKTKKPRCTICNKKLGLMVFKCKCDTRFCITHLHPEEHSCAFDYKAYERTILEKDNPRVIADKIIRI